MQPPDHTSVRKRLAVEALLMNMTLKNMRKATVEKCTIAQDVIIPTKTKGLLKQHMNKHLRIKKYFCKMCKKGFIYSNQLKRHYDKGC